MKTGNNRVTTFFKAKDRLWAIIWIMAVVVTALWNATFLNKPAFDRIITGFFNTFTIATMVVISTLAMAWITTLMLHALNRSSNKTGLYLLTFVINLIRSVPQIVGILFAYIGIATLVTTGVIKGSATIFIIMSLSMSTFIMLEVVDLLGERINHYMKLDFFNAMRVCGVSEWRVINIDILWKNSRIHILNKLISVFGSAVFLQCSVDFIISVGLSTSVNAVTLPVTLGSLLAKMDSKQDILAIGNTLTNPLYLPNLFFQHLQGITIAFLIVITLLSVYKISSGYAERNKL